MYLTREQVRAIDKRAEEEYGVPSIVLMENAGRGAAELLIRLGVRAPVCICCGKGNNGGDGLVMARHLDNNQVPVKVLLFADPDDLSFDASTNFQIAERSQLDVQVIHGNENPSQRLQEALAGCEWIVDGLFGTGLEGAIRPPFDDVVKTMNQSGLRVFALDVPSGLDCNSGQPLGATIRAAHTATFVAEKTGFRDSQSRDWTGLVHVVGIGAPRRCLADVNFTGN